MAVGLHTLVLGDDPSGWSEAGFTVIDDTVVVGGVRIACTGDAGGADRWMLSADEDDHVPADVDGITTRVLPWGPAPDAVDHPNGIDGFDHVVLRSPDLDRTTASLGTLGLDCRRIRDASVGGHDIQQRFFRMGSVIVELVGPPERSGDGPATIWGYALVAADLDRTADRLGDRLGPPRDAVQPGRRIATLRTRDLGISVPVAVMSSHVR